TPGIPEAAWPRNQGTATEWNLQTETGPTGGNTHAGRRGSAKARHSLCARSLFQESRIAGSAEALGPDVLRTRLPEPTPKSLCLDPRARSHLLPRARANRRKATLQVRDQITHILESHRQPHQLLGHAHLLALFRA